MVGSGSTSRECLADEYLVCVAQTANESAVAARPTLVAILAKDVGSLFGGHANDADASIRICQARRFLPGIFAF